MKLKITFLIMVKFDWIEKNSVKDSKNIAGKGKSKKKNSKKRFKRGFVSYIFIT